MIVKAAIKA